MTDRTSGTHRTTSAMEDTLRWVNVSGESIPAYGVVQLRSNYASGYSQASKPNDTSGLFFANGDVAVASAKKGESLLWSRPQLVLVAGSPAVGTQVGPVSGSWSMSEEGTGFYVIHQPVDGVATVVQVGGGSGGSVEFAFGILGQDSGQDDCVLPVTLYSTANLETFTAITCGTSNCSGSGSGSGSGAEPEPEGSWLGSGSGSGSGGDTSFLDMELSLCTEIGSVMALVPAGYKAGNVGLAKWPICGGGSGSGSGSGSGISDWTGWVVLFGKRSRCVAEIPVEVECCPVTNVIQFTRFSRIWFFGGALADCTNPCPTSGSGSGSGS